MRYRLMNDYSAAARAWASQFNELFDWQHGWPDAAVAAAHDAEARRLYEEVTRALPDDEVVLEYWERAYRVGPKFSDPAGPRYS